MADLHSIDLQDLQCINQVQFKYGGSVIIASKISFSLDSGFISTPSSLYKVSCDSGICSSTTSCIRSTSTWV